ncbi:MAG: peptidylprolyl isomerase [Candidatus Thalassarchaeum sp.]|nr:peptidylprolyl isomerase [Candidatus Thalassarchaeum sp.]MCS5532297.1 peptidylprolyl isomerase [Candidatus Poseidoniales archaeon]MEC8938509.1 peptidylprolyl isomerase [Candidatus Thermoplasmatota archaeon]MEC8955070.1 peptidylprolyl isomerase [Candidatus Thermoplasmatota archaeon]MEC9351314.1 peptidylprolyl isomerase [Candidatus Thermoplasmatota archaeon]
MANVIDKDTVAAVHYTGTFPDGEVFDSSEGKDPLVFLVGHRQMILGFEEEMMGAAVGEKREFTLTPDRAYGERDDGAIQQVPRDQFPADMPLEIGTMMAAQTEQGPLPFTITDISDDIVTVDFNHQMAGKTLRFSVEVVEVREAAPEEIAHGHVHGPGGHHH